jgi:hypothetical protein
VAVARNLKLQKAVENFLFLSIKWPGEEMATPGPHVHCCAQSGLPKFLVLCAIVIDATQRVVIAATTTKKHEKTKLRALQLHVKSRFSKSGYLITTSH